MFFVRPIARDDLPAVLALSERGGTGLTTLPADRDRLSERIERALASFGGTAARADACYVFVLVDGADGRVVGISAIEAAVGLKEPWYNYHVGTLVHASRALGVYTAAPTLFLANDHTGHSELCSLFLDQAYRHGKNGALLAKSRLMFIAEFAERFAPKIIAELRGRLEPDGKSPFWEGLGRHFFAMEYSAADYLTGIGQKSFIAELRGRLEPDGKSPFWEGLGRHFFAMEYSAADYLTGIGQKSFIAELMPKHPVYVNLLPPSARDAIAAVHKDTAPARAMLEQEGFRYEGYVDIFDAGPTVECFRENIDAIRRSQVLPVTLGEEDPVPDSLTDDVLWLVANRRFDAFRALVTTAPARVDRLPMLPYVAAALGVAEGDTVRAVPLAPRDR
jgi:arginine N-succinyltransferase